MLRKFASFEVLEATLAPVNDPLGLARYAHRHHFAYEPRPGYLYVRSRAISSRCNDNFDEFPANEIKTAYRTFVGKPVFVNHNNDNHRRARGVCIDAALHEDINPDGSPDTWTEVLMEVDAVRFPKLAEAIIKGHIDRTSMGTDVAFSVCSVCNNKATTPLEYCAHIPKMKGQRIYRTTASGRREGILVREICHGLKFFENSLLVEEPADPTAFFLGVDDHSSMASTASKTATAPTQQQVHHKGDAVYHPSEGWGGRVIGVHGDGTYTVRLGASGWEDDDPTWLPDPNSAPHSPGQERRVHQNHIVKSPYLREREQSPGHFAKAAAFNPYVAHGDHHDLQDGHMHFSEDARQEMVDASSAGKLHAEMQSQYQKTPANLNDRHELLHHMLTAHEGHESLDNYTHPELLEEHEGEHEEWKDDWPNAVNMDGHHFHEASKTAHSDHEHAEHGPLRDGGTYQTMHRHRTPDSTQVAGLGCPGCDWKGFTEDARNEHMYEHHPDAPDTGQAEIDLIKRLRGQGQRTAHNYHEDMQRAPGESYPHAHDGGPDNPYEYEAGLGCPHCSDAFLNEGERTDHIRSAHPGEYSGPDEEMSFVKDRMHEGTKHVAYGETMAPADVDTLRDEECPVCGEADAYDGNECQVCGFVAPPKMFQDPNLDTAKSMDLRKDITEGSETDPNEDGMPDVIPGSGQPGSDEIPMNANEIADPDDAGQQQVDKITDEQQPLQPGEIADDGQVADEQQTDDDGNTPDLMCPECGFETEATPPQSTPTDADAPDTPQADGAVEGDVCPNCGKGLLTTAQDIQEEDPEQSEAVPVGRAASAVKGWNDSHADRRAGHTQKEQSMRPALAAIAAQQRVIDTQAARIATLEAQVGFIARVAGVTQHVAALKVEADVNNPAQPIPDPPSEAAFESTEQAATPEAMDSPLNPGMTPGSVNNLAADTTTTPLEPGVALDSPPFNVLENVQAPVAGTETQRPLDETKIETDVRVGDPMNPQVAFPWTLSSLSPDERAVRTMASLRLAQLRRQAGISTEDELGLAEKIASDETMIPAVIDHEIATLSTVTKNAAVQQARPAARPGGLVPRAASQGVQRTVPSLSAEAGLATLAGGGSVQDDTTDSDLFD